jgi:hypothetical protein
MRTERLILIQSRDRPQPQGILHIVQSVRNHTTRSVLTTAFSQRIFPLLTERYPVGPVGFSPFLTSSSVSLWAFMECSRACLLSS